MARRVTRRSMLAGIGSGAAYLLFEQPLMAGNGLDSTTNDSATKDPNAQDPNAQSSSSAASTRGVAASGGSGAAGVGAPGRLNLSLIAVSAQTLRIGIAPVHAEPSLQELGVVARSWPSPVEQLSSTDREGPASSHTVVWGKYMILVKDDPLQITVSERNGKLRQEIRFDNDSTAIHFKLGDAPLFGLGEGVHPIDRRGTKDAMTNGQSVPELRTYGARLPIPWLLSTDGWGLFVGQPSGSFDLSADEGIFQTAEATSTRNVFLILGDTPADLLLEYAGLTGFPHMPPLWALGFQQSHRTLASEEEIVSEAKTFREKKLPCDAMIYLGTGFCPSGWNTGHGSFTFNQDVFPDPSATIQKLHDQHFKVIVHIVPPGDFHGSIMDTGAAAATPGDAVTYWAKHLPVDRAGVDGWWPDEGDRLSVYARFDRNRMYWEGPLQVHPGQRPFALHRNGYAGLQRFGWLWSGDIESTWKTLRAQIMVGINVGLCGIPYWGTDTGGFIPTVDLTPELYVRWFQFSSFCPSFRAHGQAWKLRLPWGWNQGTPGPLESAQHVGPSWPPEPDLHRPDVEQICRRYLDLRYQMLPYLYSTVAQAHATGLPLMRSLWIAYPEDPRAVLKSDQYLWGDSVLVAPVLEKNATHRTAYLPRGLWWDFWTNERLEGGRDTIRAVDLATMPLYVKAGAILLLGPAKQYATQASDQPVTLRIYPGADGDFSWYEDDGASFRYEQGKFTRIRCRWSDRERILTLACDPDGEPAFGRVVRVEVGDGSSTRTVTLGKGETVVKL